MMWSDGWFLEELRALATHCGFKHDWDCDCVRTYRYLIRIAKPGRVR